MKSLIEAMIKRMPSVLLLPLDFPGLGGLPGLRRVRRLSPATRIVVVSPVRDQNEELEVLRRGARGYSGPVETDTMFKMIEKVDEGEVWAARKTIGTLLDELWAKDGDVTAQQTPIAADNLKRLTSRERQILRLLTEGASNKEIANSLKVSVSTVKAHLTKIFRKLGQPDRVRLALSVTGGLPGGEPQTS